MLVGLASNFIIGDEVILIPLDAEKHTETPLMEGIDPACVFLGNRPALTHTEKIGNIQVL